MLGDIATDRVLFNACILAYASRNFGTLERLITESGERDEYDEEDDANVEGEEMLTEPTGRDSKEWIAYIRDNKEKITPKMSKALAAAWNSIGDTRPGTIGEWVKGRVGTLSSISRLPTKPKPKKEAPAETSSRSKRKRAESTDESSLDAMDVGFMD